MNKDIFLLFNYKTSKDYEKLFELLKTNKIVCLINHHIEIEDKNVKIQQLCTNFSLNDDKEIMIGIEGKVIIFAHETKDLTMKELFLSLCKEKDLEYIEPNI